MSAPGGEHGNKAIVAAFFANLGIAIAKFIGFLITRSSSMLAESVHSVADTGNQALLLLGSKRAKKEATDLYQFGFGRERYFWSFVVSMVLFSLGSMFALYEGIHKIQHPEALESPTVAYGILIVAIALESFSFRVAIKESAAAKGSLGWWQFLKRAKTPELPVVLLEDAGAMFGLVIALAAITTGEITSNPKWDGYGTLTIGVLLGVIALFLAIEMKGLLIGESADVDVDTKIRAAITNDTDVVTLIHLRTQHMGPEEILVAGKIEFNPSLSGQALAATIDRIETSVRTEVPFAEMIYLEPDMNRA